MVPQNWGDLTVDSQVQLVFSMVCRGDTPAGPHLVQSADRRGAKIWVHGSLPSGQLLGGLGLQVTSLSPIHLSIVDSSYVYAIPPCVRFGLFQVVDLCCGLGGFSCLLGRVGMRLKFGVDHNAKWEPLFRLLHQPDACFLHGDINDPAIVRTLVEGGCLHGVLCAGISCNAHSILGDQLGMSDPRSLSLPKALQTAYMLQSACFVLECTPAIMRDQEAQTIIMKFAEATGYRVSQTLVQLSNSWCSRRERWFGLFCAPLLGACNLVDLPALNVCPVVRDLMPVMHTWPEHEQAQISLNLYELAKYYSYASGGIANAFLQPDGKLPTLLHSTGNALYDCSCGCRPALSEARLQNRGLIGILVPTGGSQVHMNQVMEHCRYLHPEEMWCLMGGMPGLDFGPHLRLAMGGIGQAVSPIAGLWIFAQIRRHLDSFLDCTDRLCPHQVLSAYVHEVKQRCLAKWPPPIPPTVPDPIVEVDAEMLELDLVCPADGDVIQTIRCPTGTTCAQLVAAEAKLGTLDFDFEVTVNGDPIDLNKSLDEKVLVTLVPSGWDVRSQYVEAVACCLDEDCTAEGDRLGAVVAPGAEVTSIGQLLDLRRIVMPQAQRLEILSRQGPTWGDDELLYWLEHCATSADELQNVVVWDPLLISGLVLVDNPGTWAQLTAVLAKVVTVISAVVIDQHWVPLVWRLDEVGCKLFTGSIKESHGSVMQTLAQIPGLGRNGQLGVWTSLDFGFQVTSHCGAAVIAFVRHLLLETPMPRSQDAVNSLASALRLDFASGLLQQCMVPRLAGLGQVDLEALCALLVQQGVAGDEVKLRAQTLLCALGDGPVAKALTAVNPWRELKWLANQQRPPFLIVKPSELNEKVKQRQGKGSVGQKSHKHAKGKGKGSKPGVVSSLDPTRLRLELGLLQSTDGTPLAQVSLPQVASHVSGVVLTTLALAGPYLRAASIVSTGALAFFLVDTVLPLTSGLRSTVVTLPLICAENSEPLLVEGLLVQLGATPVCRPDSTVGCQVQSIPTCVVKFMVFRDMIVGDWNQVVAHPLQYIIQKVCPLQVCSDEECPGCEAWHRTDQFPVDSPILEVWGRQWMKQTFAFCSPEEAEVYAVHLRLPETLQISVQEFSGTQGVFAEPKTVCGRKPSTVFQVIWTPRTSLSQLVMQRQTLPEVCGVARLGAKLGLRCRVEHAAALSAKIRPEQVFLPAGDRMTFLVGPMPYGTLRSSLTKTLGDFGWTVRPLQPVSTGTQVQGLMFRVQAIAEPPKKVLRMSHEDVVVTRETEVAQVAPALPSVVASHNTVSKASSDQMVDELQIHDPWAKPGPRTQKLAPQTVHLHNPLEDMEQRVVSAVLAQLPRASMDVDSEGTHDPRVDHLEKEMHELKQHAQCLQESMSQHAADHNKQLHEVRDQMQQQGAHFEAAIASHASQLHAFQESFQEQFRQQSVNQQSMLDSMFHKQMSQFESLLAKRHRPE